MLYQLYESQRSIMEPFADLAEVASRMFSNPQLPFAQLPMAQRISAGYDLLHRLGKDYEKPEFGIRTVDVDGVNVAIHERVDIDKPFCELRRFKRFTDDPNTLTKLKGQPVVLVVAPLSGHYATLLRDTVRTLLKDHKVYITDWKNARLVPLSEGEFRLDDYINYVQEFIGHVQGIYGNCHVMSVCQPTVPVLAAVSLMASRGEKVPLSMTMMGGPIDARKSPTAVNNLAMQRSYEWFENNVIYRVPDKFPGAGRRVYPGFLQHSGFVAMNPDRHASSHYDYFQDLVKGDNDSVEAHRKFYDEYNAVLDMDADYYLDTIKTVFQDFELVKGTWDVRNEHGKLERVRPQDITNCGLLTIEGELDDISGAGQTAAAHALCTGIPKAHQMHYEAKGAGHYGIFSGRRWREMVYPTVKAFIAAHQVRPAAKAPARPAAKAPARPAAKARARSA
ncbi:MAG: polyhydroxyalkanoate depolymerase [Hydrogenophaga sp.]|uniref:polyhydroxyalkanoate depolymerase n=1 Tax=Hydrogenophaga sp. TaxID=1904254 RepID=UPI00168E8081|nr:polyhydroxyalkanoate depolymerase [Hydrogenophaga sp.]NIM41218.1 polyhydroxyalkanoate depolymerase [Hydrogenophaga sp.]NIN26534.1 polyhydroxyalkanoate depolymerase [Hydrogenophaga sp.]NIN31409.1 polyhydroxyalkanoate depolymerase [Hydrogenophaga sp.]NIN55464.1 polyhydroxyalkanoate depolymerase [Hydrogenophaga sp.]NIO51799.1 polyhydroxyalkanoate depolymerase [Hydrogenophaga sp.]